MFTSSRLPSDDGGRSRSGEPPGLSLALGAQLLACGLLGWTVFAVGVDRFLPHVNRTRDTVVAAPSLSPAPDSAAPARHVQIAAAGPTVPHSQH